MDQIAFGEDYAIQHMTKKVVSLNSTGALEDGSIMQCKKEGKRLV